MRLSRYFLPVLKEAPAEAEIVSHKLMLRAGMIQQLSAGIYKRRTSQQARRLTCARPSSPRHRSVANGTKARA